ncbi:calcitonin receptor [Microcebus murinus]|uniref:Calcitonin receptor n=1 Tax=Microcebus murinus TaxID=30608 RepID=A0A8C5VHB0_MICMU|nr:calcitonin receptor isoform X2 [Microcebus murinus]
MKIKSMCQWLALFILLSHPTLTLRSSSSGNTSTTEPEPFLYTIGRKKLQEAEKKCYERMQQMPPYQGEGPYCNRTWDGWMCWDDTPAGETSVQSCPGYFPDFDPSERVTRYCDETGVWFKHPETNESWSNYTLCNSFTPEKIQNAYILYYLALVGHSLSIITLIAALGVFFYFKRLGCQRVTLHKHLFVTYVMNSIIIIVHLLVVVPNGNLVRRDPASCKILHFFHQYMMSCNYFWMLCEGIYLHTLIVMAVFVERQRMWWYYLLGWGFPALPTVAHAITRAVYYDDNCWLSMETYLLYIIHGPVMAALVINFFFLLNIVRVLVVKMKQTREPESYMYLKAVKATLILVPLLGIQFVIFPWRPSNKVLGQIYDYVMHSLIHFQGFFVAVIHCFCNSEVQTTLKRHWAQYKLQRNRWGSRPSNRSAARAAAAAAAEAGDIPIYICHQELRNELAIDVEEEEEGVEIIPLNVIEQESSA